MGTMSRFIVVVSIVSIVLCALLAFMYVRGAIHDTAKHSGCFDITHDINDARGFCDIQLVPISLPPYLQSPVFDISLDQQYGKYVSFVDWKAGRTLATSDCLRYLPELINFYKDLVPAVSEILETPVTVTPLDLPTSCCVLIYEKEGDFINWHYDVNYYNGRFFTLLIPVNEDDTCTKFVYKNANKQDIDVTIPSNRALLFEGDKVFHMASKLCVGQVRVVVSMQFVTDPRIPLHNRLLMSVKDRAYVGFV